MNYDLNKSIEILERTPSVLNTLLSGLHEDWLMNNEGADTFSPYDVIGHLIHGEKIDWRSRIQRIIDDGDTKAFDVFDRFAMYTESAGKTVDTLLKEFETLRKENLQWLKKLDLTKVDFEKKGLHPKFGQVTMKNLLATWVVHDLTHLAQITRVMAKQYKEEVGPWVEYLRILNI